MHPKPCARTRAAILASATAATAAVAVLGALAPGAVAAQAPLPLPVAAAESLVTEGVTVEGPLINNLTLPTLR
ncbi:hypothetical protein [Streptomyces sp. NPDC046862]|uniref:hypothetical protein n=1 Tax=Streptomyces sp. NPDC046862 TaxID=3154603 RepID=UPI00345276D1